MASMTDDQAPATKGKLRLLRADLQKSMRRLENTMNENMQSMMAQFADMFGRQEDRLAKKIEESEHHMTILFEDLRHDVWGFQKIRRIDIDDHGAGIDRLERHTGLRAT